MNRTIKDDPDTDQNTLTIEKIGGTSMTALQQVIDNIILFGSDGNTPRYNRVFVVSAFSGVTDMLLENKKNGKPGVYHAFKKYQDFNRPLKKLVASLKTINNRYQPLGLNVELANIFLEKRIYKAQKYLSNLANILSSGYVSKEGILQAAREILASIGETHSAYTLTQILQNRGINTQLIDLSGFDDHNSFTIDQRIKSAFKHINLSDSICIVTGYAKGTEGIMREFDRGYSEVTFSKIAQILKPHEAIIHKEYHLSTADPAMVGIDNCLPVGFTNYDIADQLADVGMEAIHPKASKPLEIGKIDLRIKNTFEPSHPGTLITRDYVSEHKRVEIITGTDKLLIVDVYDPNMVGNVGSDLLIMQILAKYGISYTFKTTSANSISTVIWEKDYSRKLIADLSAAFEQVTVAPAAMVCLLGSNMDRPGLLAKSAAALASVDINIMSAGLAMRKVNIQFLVAREHYAAAIVALNSAMSSNNS
ncbi:aspartate kinase [Mucilaginibacter pallidiroseus]|uniref:aspartate kinase n=1 Tax=Mucilaginibacter pallidiroseus TaxID=2599295 RepID=A0A563UCE4_9SPHI|nr:aspartate kinase [Mucilaginibacter pallidiroseus]TWR28929.1 aspartate kinase [Mucilaginibacter pallidiroseus]